MVCKTSAWADRCDRGLRGKFHCSGEAAGDQARYQTALKLTEGGIFGWLNESILPVEHNAVIVLQVSSAI